MCECMEDIMPDMGHGDFVRTGLLPTGWAKKIVRCEQGCTVQAVGWMHVTPLALKYKLNVISIKRQALSIYEDFVWIDD